MFILFLILLNAFFVMAEYSLARIRQGQLLEMKEEGFEGADTLLRIYEKRNHYISATQIGVTCTSLILGWYGGPLLAKWLLQLSWMQEWLKDALEAGDSLPITLLSPETEISTLSVFCAFLILALLHVAVGELVPRIIVWDRVEAVIRHMGAPLRIIHALTYPFVSIAFCLAKGITRLFGIRYSPKEDISRSEDELRQIVSASEMEGELDSAERTMIDNVFEFDDTVAKEVMIPLQDMVCIYTDDTLEEIPEIVRNCHHTRFPVCEEDKDHVLGVLHVRDLLKIDTEQEFDIRSLLYKTIMVPEGMSALRVLQTMQKQCVHLAIVVDEYGGTAGLVTLEDLLEEIVGDMDDEFTPAETPEVIPLANGSYDIDGELPLDDVSELLELSFEAEDEDDTIGGYIFGRLGRKPEEGDEVTRRNWRFTVLKMDQFRIDRVKAEKLEDK